MNELTFNGIKSSKTPPFELIPREALVALARIFEAGIEQKGVDGAWNGRRADYHTILTRDFVINRLGHCIDHSSKAIQRLVTGQRPEPNDAGAIMFAGALLAVYMEVLAEVQPAKPGVYEALEDPKQVAEVMAETMLKRMR